MTKRLSLVLTIAFVLGISFAAYAEVQNVKVSGDLTAQGIVRELGLNNGASNDADKDQAAISITRVRIDADLTDNVSTTVRLLNERYWGSQDEDTTNTDIDLDLAYVTLKEFLYSPLTLTVGRQELRFGNAMIVGDPDTNNQADTASVLGGTTSNPDLSARKAFDAVRATFNYDPLIVDILASKITEGTRATQDDSDLYGVNANYALTKNTTLEGYWFGQYAARELGVLPNKPDRVDAVGGRIVNSALENIIYQLEAAYQFGKDRVAGAAQTVDRRALAVETALTYNMPKVKYTPSLTGLYAYFNGNRGNNNRNSAWQPMFEDQKFGDIANAQFDQSNAHIAGAIASVKPTNDLTLTSEYYAFWWDKKYGDNQVLTTRRGDSATMKHEKFAGHEVDLKAVYAYTEDVQLSLLAGVFLPGDAFDKVTDNTATELIGSMKVTF